MRFDIGSVIVAAALLAPSAPAWAQKLPAEIGAPGETAVVTLHAQGAQIYECVGKDGKFVWAFREPIASLFLKGKTVGRHYAGPNWEYMDGSAVVAKVSGNAPGATPKDIPLLRLAVTAHRGMGLLSGVTTIQRINTAGGAMAGSCNTLGTFFSAPYAADYVFLRK